MEESIELIFYVVLGLLFLKGALYMVKQKHAVVIERLGKFNKVSKAGLHFKIPVIDKISGSVNLRVRELPVEVETKTKDDVFVKIVVSVQFFVIDNSEGIKHSFYELNNPEQQIQSYVFDSIRSEVPLMELDDVFAQKEKIAQAIKSELSETMRQFGFDFIKALVTDIDPDAKVKHSMNEINAAKRMKEAAKEEAAAAKIRVVAAAEADAESKRLAGEGIAQQRIAIANGLKESVEEVKLAMEEHVTSQDIMNMLFMTQHYETISKLSENNTSTIFMPYSPDNVGDLQMQIQSSLIAVNSMKNKKESKK
ncbi:MAG TPA: SPFH domain-containing protein [Flavobacteriales bacterium]|nr:SPFH domain-containing protein [Flavobacteriales bacterium]HIB78391.1 SPFH domain-containing protein [Flavobacteriales bacterium]HIO15392.1 SPFH domain-containing protein [Flavobacteriales bacterium]HIO59055.1 SPFH domain-containing protein [Flavobacteriales bacterium]